jgi:SpoVK/Ycf46/Vps4 family AAA+-type ATPase
VDDTTLASLRQALRASPDNVALLSVVLRALLDRGEAEEAHALLRGHAPRDFTAEADRVTASRAYLAGGDAASALACADGDSAESLAARARALLALGRSDEARAAYDDAIALNPTLEDAALAAELRSGSRPASVAEIKGRPRLKVIEGGGEKVDEETLAALVTPERGRVTFADVGGLEDVKKQVRKRIILPFQKPSLFSRFKRSAGGGILLYGPPGCGKTLLARATAGECAAAFFNIAISDILDMWLGESEQKLHAIFEKARHAIPSVLFFDELEALGGKRVHARESTTAKLISQFLAEMDGFTQANAGVLVLGATNLPWAVDAAFRRPGRFDRFMFVPPPDRAARAEILRIHLQERPVEGAIDVDALAQRTSGFSGADLENLVGTAADAAIEASLESGAEVPIRQEHFKAALSEVKPTTLEWLTTARNHARYANEGGQYDDVLAFLDRHGKD